LNAIVQYCTTLPCNHEAKWLCGSDEDPRENSSNCQLCVLNKWKNIINKDVSLERQNPLCSIH